MMPRAPSWATKHMSGEKRIAKKLQSTGVRLGVARYQQKIQTVASFCSSQKKQPNYEITT